MGDKLLLEHGKDGLIRPYHNQRRENKAMFSHCAEGMIAVTQDYFDEFLKTTLELHDTEWEFVNESDQKS